MNINNTFLSAAKSILYTLLLASLLAACAEKKSESLQGYAEGEFVRVAAPFAGTLEKLNVQRGEQVAQGAPLFALENQNENAAKREAEQRLPKHGSPISNPARARRKSTSLMRNWRKLWQRRNYRHHNWRAMKNYSPTALSAKNALKKPRPPARVILRASPNSTPNCKPPNCLRAAMKSAAPPTKPKLPARRWNNRNGG
jgi:pyruvate/2-oxoglutarate dehydrogenase complex dihydrolipoamide acyltransferase (E2) component